MSFAVSITFSSEEQIAAFKQDQYFLDNKTIRGGTYTFNDSEAWNNVLIMDIADDGHPYIQAIIQKIASLAKKHGGTYAALGTAEGQIAGSDAGTEFDSKEKPLVRAKADAPANSKIFTQSNLPAANHAAANAMKSCFAAAMEETGASMKIGEVNQATQLFSITYTRGNHDDTNSDIENSMRSLNKVKEPRPEGEQRQP